MLKINEDTMREGRQWMFQDGHLWVSTSEASRQMNLDHGTLNRDCRLAIDEEKGNLKDLQAYVCSTARNNSRLWWVRKDIDEVYTMRAPGKGRNRAWFFVSCLMQGPRPGSAT